MSLEEKVEKSMNESEREIKKFYFISTAMIIILFACMLILFVVPTREWRPLRIVLGCSMYGIGLWNIMRCYIEMVEIQFRGLGHVIYIASQCEKRRREDEEKEDFDLVGEEHIPRID